MEAENATDCTTENGEVEASIVTLDTSDTLPADSPAETAESTDTAEQVAIDYTPSGRNGFATVTARRGDELVFVDEFNLTKAKARAAFVKGVCSGADVDAGPIEAELLKIADNLANRNGDTADDKTELPDDEVAENASGSEAGAATVELVEALAIDYTPSNRNGSVTLTARLGNEPILVESVNLAREKNRAAFAAKVCDGRPGIDKQAVEAELLRIAAELASKPNKAAESETTQTSAELLAKMPDTAKSEAPALLDHPDLMKRIIDDVSSLGVAGERELIAAVYLVGVSRLLDRPLAAIVQGHTSSGKSYVCERVANLLPPEVLHATQMTNQALFYMPAGSLKHRFILAGERSRKADDDAAEATRALREMLSAGKLSKLVTMKTEGQMESKLVEQDGPIAYIESTTMTAIFDEDANRCLLLTTDERKEQTRRVVSTLAAQYAGKNRSGDAERIIARHHAAQRILQQRPVVIPYAGRLGELFDSDRVEVRRAFPQLMSMIQASAMLHQRQRKIDGDGRIIAIDDDYQLARHLLVKPFQRLLGGGLSDPARRYFDGLQSWAVAADFTTTEAADKVKVQFSRRAVTGWLSELADAGLVEQLEANKGPKPAKWRLTGAA